MLASQSPEHVRDIEITTGGFRPAYVDPVQWCINQLRRLELGWDGGRALPITYEAAEMTVQVIFDILDNDSALPQFFPLVDGGIQIEWHAAGNDVEIEIEGVGGIHAYARGPDRTEVVNGDIYVPGSADQLTRLRDFVRHVSGCIAEASHGHAVQGRSVAALSSN